MAEVWNHAAAGAGATPMAGRTIGPYTIQCLIGRGGMGEVFLARDARLGRDVAIKIVGDTFLGPAGDPNQLLREARAVAKLSHPHIATIHDVLDIDGQAAIVMEYLRGEPLSQRIAKGALPLDEVLRIADEVSAAVAYAHRNNILHCDLKPANVFLTEDGGAKVLDFGLARPLFAHPDESGGAIGASPSLIRMGAGTPAYMAPEHLAGKPIDARADIYSLGVMLHEMVTGQRPSHARARVLDPSATTGPANERVVTGTVPDALRRVISRALAPRADQRYASVGELRAAIQQSARPPRPLRLNARVLVPLVVSAAMVAILSVAVWQWSHASGAAAPSRRTVLAVVPFTSVDATGSTRYLAAGVTEMIASDLATSPDLVVVSAASAAGAASRLKNLADVARDLGAGSLLTGDIAAHGADLRVTLRLFDAATGEVHAVGSVDAPLADIAGRRQPLLEAVRDRLAHAGLRVGPAAQAPSLARASQAVIEDYVQGRELLARTDFDGALTLFGRALARDPQFALAHAGIGEASWQKYRKTKDPSWAAKAQAAAFEAMRLAPGEATVRYTAAVVLYGTGRRREAEEEVLRAIEMQPANDDAHRLLGRIYAQSGRFAQAKAEFDAAIALRPGFAGAYHALGLACFDNGRFDEAIAAFQRETELRPDAAAFQALGTSYHAVGRLDEALVNYERATSGAPSAFAYSNIGMIHYAKGRYPQAVAAYEKSAALTPGEAVTHRNLGDSLAKAGDGTRARREYQRAIDLATEQLKINSRDGTLLSLQAVCEAKIGRGAIALTRIGQALAVAPTNNEVLYQAGVVNALVGNTAQAFAFLRKAVARGYSANVLAEDKDLAPLRKLGEFQSILKDNAASPGAR